MSLLDEATELGIACAWIDNAEMDTGVTDARKATERRESFERLRDICDVIGEAAETAFAEGYDATIDFSLNTAWREGAA